MRISYFYAENMAGIKAGTGLDKIELNLEGHENNIFNLLLGGNGSGKAQPLNSQVMTPYGIKTIGELKIGDIIYDPEGYPVMVDGIFDKGLLSEFKLALDDDSIIRCNDGHLFKVYHTDENDVLYTSVYTLRELLDKGLFDKDGKPKFKIRCVNPINYLNLPYNKPDRSTKEFEPIKDVHDTVNLYWALSSCKYSEYLDSPDIFILLDDKEDNALNYIKKCIQNFTVINSAICVNDLTLRYLYLMIFFKVFGISSVIGNKVTVTLNIDSDKYESDEFQNYYLPLFKELVLSLGGYLLDSKGKVVKFTSYENKDKITTEYRIFEFYMPKKFIYYLDNAIARYDMTIPGIYYLDCVEDYLYRDIVNIAYNNKKVEMRCIHINSVNHTYISDNYIETHNTSLLSILHPFRETYDGRNVVPENEKAYKEVHLVDGDDEYVIKHTWKPNKSYISKNGEELNESGSIKLFMQYAKEKLGIDDEYFKIGRLGSNVTNFTDLTSGPRKTYIGEYLPYIDDYLKAYEDVKKSYTVLNKDLQNVGAQLDKYPELDILSEKATQQKESIEMNKTALEDNKKTLYSTIIPKIDKLIAKFEAKYNISYDEIDSVIDKIEELEIYIDKCKKDIAKKKVTIRSKLASIEFEEGDFLKNKSGINNLLGEMEDKGNKEKDKIEKKKRKIEKEIEKKDRINKSIKEYENLNQIDYESEIEELERELNENKERLKNLSKEIKNKKYKEELIGQYEFDVDSFDDITDKYDKLKSLILHLLQAYNINSDIDYKLLKKHKKFKVRVNEIQILIKELSDELAYIDKNRSLLDILDKRPNDCITDDCSFIKNALDYKTNHYNKRDKIESELSELQDELEELNTDINKCELTLSFNEEAIFIFNKLNELLSEYNPYTEVFNSEFNKDIFINEFLHMNIDTISSILDLRDKLNYLKKYYNYIEVESNIKSTEKIVSNYKKELSNTESLRESYQNNKAEITLSMKRIDELDSELSDLEYLLYEINIIIDLCKKVLELYDRGKELNTEYKTYSEMIDDYEEINKEMESITDEKENIQATINRLNDSIEREEDEYEDTKKSLNYVEILLDNKKELDDKFSKTKLVRDALDPKKGIPLLFIDRFLDKIQDKVNELLDIAYNSEFRIKFELTDRDFFIKVYKGLSVLPDISNASQGETSLTSVSLSLAMIQYMVRKYNILYLDEIDGTLSNKNRRIFLTLLEKQIEDLGIEQIFVITHNKEFYSYPVNLILLNVEETDFDIDDPEMMENKDIVFNLKDYKKEIDDKLKINQRKRRIKKDA